jgi:hypothetical protein
MVAPFEAQAHWQLLKRQLAEQMADRLRALIKEYQSLGRPVPEWLSARLALVRRLLADLENTLQ